MLSYLRNTIFREKINEDSAKQHLNDPEWFDTHWDELVESFGNLINFNAFIACRYTMMRNELSIEMLEVFLRHGLSFKDTNLSKEYLWMTFDFNKFKWFIDHQIIENNNNNNMLCNKLLSKGDRVSFEKFKYAFEAGFPFDIQIPIIVKDVFLADEIWEYANNSRQLEFQYTLPSHYIDPLKLTQYIEWIRRRNIDDSLELFGLNIFKLDIPALEVLWRYGYIIPSDFSGNIKPEVKNWLIAHGFTERIIPERPLNTMVYYNTPIQDNIPDNISVATDVIC